MNQRDTIFISHATPQDNEFSIWLASRLEMLGYKVWVDKKKLLGGESFWGEIQDGILSASKFLLVYSHNIIGKNGRLKGGVQKEYSFAESQVYKDDLKDFIIPLHIDNSPYDLFIGAPETNHIPFAEDWAEGLKTLLKKFKEDGIVPITEMQSSLSGWYEGYVSDIKVGSKPQTYFSSWIGFKKMPQHFFLYRCNSESEAIRIKKANPEIPINRTNNELVSFEGNLDIVGDTEDRMFDSKPAMPDVFKITLEELNWDDDGSTTFPNHKQKRSAFIRLMSTLWSKLMYQGNLSKYVMSGNRFAYFKADKEKRYEKIKYILPDYPSRPKRKAIVGKFGENTWHYALSASVITSPTFGYELKSHIIFSQDGVNPITEDKKQHSLRRAKGKRMFNKEWRDLFLAFLQSLKNKNGKLGCYVGYVTSDGENDDYDDPMYVEVDYIPIAFQTNWDYTDPTKEMNIESVEGVTTIEEDNE